MDKFGPIVAKPADPQTLRMLQFISRITNMTGADLDPGQIGMALVQDVRVKFIVHLTTQPWKWGEYRAENGDRMIYLNTEAGHFHYNSTKELILYVDCCTVDHTGYLWRW